MIKNTKEHQLMQKAVLDVCRQVQYEVNENKVSRADIPERFRILFASATETIEEEANPVLTEEDCEAVARGYR